VFFKKLIQLYIYSYLKPFRFNAFQIFVPCDGEWPLRMRSGHREYTINEKGSWRTRPDQMRTFTHQCDWELASGLTLKLCTTQNKNNNNNKRSVFIFLESFLMYL
jgi:hypothetical protein